MIPVGLQCGVGIHPINTPSKAFVHMTKLPVILLQYHIAPDYDTIGIESIYSLQNVEASRLNSCNCFIHFIRTTWLLEHSIHVRGYWGLAAGHTLILPPPTFYR